MKYDHVLEGYFLKRRNRFAADVKIGGRENICHVKNTGRLRELLVPGTLVCLQESANPDRKTKYDLIAVRKGDKLINIDSQAPNVVAEEWIRAGNLFPEASVIKREKTYGNSRFDLYVEYQSRRAFIEAKGVTLEEGGIARFPDAPTLRGVKHIRELMKAREEGYEAYILFVIQMRGVASFAPNWRTQSEFGECLRMAKKAGVYILARDCVVTENSICMGHSVDVDLD